MTERIPPIYIGGTFAYLGSGVPTFPRQTVAPLVFGEFPPASFWCAFDAMEYARSVRIAAIIYPAHVFLETMPLAQSSHVGGRT